MVTFKFTCPQCGKPVTTDEELRGKVIKCPHCEKGIVVPCIRGEKAASTFEKVKDAAKSAADVAYRKVKDVDWKAKGEQAKRFADDTSKKANGIVGKAMPKMSSYFSFKGRATRFEYWVTVLTFWLVDWIVFYLFAYYHYHPIGA